MIEVTGLAKTFILHNQGGAALPVFAGLAFTIGGGECVALHGASGSGKSTLLRSLYANYRPSAGEIHIRHGETVVDLLSAPPRHVLEIRRRTIGYVSQVFRTIPRVAAADVVAEPLRLLGVEPDRAIGRARAMLSRLNIPERLWSLAPATFSGGEQQRVNIARTFVVDFPILLLDEPTSALDVANRAVVIDLINEAKARGAAIVGIFHDHEVRDAVADRLFELAAYKAAA